MDLYQEEGNPGNLKVAAASEFVGFKLNVHEVNADVWPPALPSWSKLPALQLPSGAVLFSTNAICRCGETGHPRRLAASHLRAR
ncbi:unnamed protein product [Lampetra planeri]